MNARRQRIVRLGCGVLIITALAGAVSLGPLVFAYERLRVRLAIGDERPLLRQWERCKAEDSDRLMAVPALLVLTAAEKKELKVAVGTFNSGSLPSEVAEVAVRRNWEVLGELEAALDQCERSILDPRRSVAAVLESHLALARVVFAHGALASCGGDDEEFLRSARLLGRHARFFQQQGGHILQICGLVSERYQHELVAFRLSRGGPLTSALARDVQLTIPEEDPREVLRRCILAEVVAFDDLAAQINNEAADLPPIRLVIGYWVGRLLGGVGVESLRSFWRSYDLSVEEMPDHLAKREELLGKKICFVVTDDSAFTLRYRLLKGYRQLTHAVLQRSTGAPEKRCSPLGLSESELELQPLPGGRCVIGHTSRTQLLSVFRGKLSRQPPLRWELGPVRVRGLHDPS